MATRLEDKTAIVTGAGRGLGRAIALAMSREGANVILMSRTLPELEEVASNPPCSPNPFTEDLRITRSRGY